MEEIIKICIVDDEIDICEIIAANIEDALKNVQIFKASNAGEALALAEKHEFQLLITDFKMPGMDAGQMLKFWMQLPNATRPRHIAILSAYFDDHYKDGNFEKGVTYLKKPINDAVFNTFLKRIFPRYFKLKSPDKTDDLLHLPQLTVEELLTQNKLKFRVDAHPTPKDFNATKDFGFIIQIKTEKTTIDCSIYFSKNLLLKLFAFGKKIEPPSNYNTQVEEFFLRLGNQYKNLLIRHNQSKGLYAEISGFKIWKNNPLKMNHIIDCQQVIIYKTIPGDIFVGISIN